MKNKITPSTLISLIKNSHPFKSKFKDFDLYLNHFNNLNILNDDSVSTKKGLQLEIKFKINHPLNDNISIEFLLKRYDDVIKTETLILETVEITPTEIIEYVDIIIERLNNFLGYYLYSTIKHK